VLDLPDDAAAVQAVEAMMAVVHGAGVVS